MRDADHGARLHIKKEAPSTDEDGFVYSRWGNPTNEMVAKTISGLEGAKDALIFSSGMNAITCSLMASLKSGDHAIFPHCVYGGTAEFVKHFLTKQGVQVDFVDSTDVSNYEKKIKPNTRVMYAETPANPTMRLTDLEALGAISLKAKSVTGGIKPLVHVDNTFSTPFHVRVLEYKGIDVSIQSCTKYLGGHSDVLAGAVATNDATFMHELSKVRKIFGSLLDPFSSYLLGRGIRTLHVRMERHAVNAMHIASALEKHPLIERVAYPGLKSHPDHALAKKQFSHGFGGMVSFIVKGGLLPAKHAVENLQIINLAVSLGSVESLISHPSSMTHGMLSKEQREAGGLPG